MVKKMRRVAILFPVDNSQMLATSLERSRHAGTAAALEASGLEVVGAPYADALVDDIRELLLGVDGVLIWFNPNEGGRDRSVLNAMLRDVASTGVMVSTHPDIIDRIGTKEVLFRTRNMGWGSDTRHYATADAMREGLSTSLALGTPRVLKQIRGQSGDGVWFAAVAKCGGENPWISSGTRLTVQHAKRGSPKEAMTLDAFVARCSEYFSASHGIIDQVYQSRLSEGMVRCYLVRDRVVGFGEQLINMLYPAPLGASASHTQLPGPRLYYPPTRPDFQALKEKLELQWVGELCRIVGLKKSQLPVLWDADFLYGPKGDDGADTYVLCEINVSSVYPFPPSALAPLVAETASRIGHP